MVPVTQPLDVRGDGWIAAATCTVASAELGGVARLECTKPSLAAAIVDLHARYLAHDHAAKDMIPVVKCVVHDVTAAITLEIVGWTPRTAVFGERVNPVPAATSTAPQAPQAATNGSGDPAGDLMAALHERMQKARAAREDI